ncbi:ABCF1 [Symbiodinium natans]|uniref:ABCF1 protein n=1 Tax=Symbiodinium natans TaxID=878477 RepID=A0A812I2E1_9DINO|nr:ABCF1 [Symbiodinium natans]
MGHCPLAKVEVGARILGVGGLRRARVAYFTQDLAQDLPGDMTPVEHVLGDDAPISLDMEGARAALGALGLRGACHNSPIRTLSGGEKARVALAVFATRPADVLLLDEPTNHLDGAAVASLCTGLREHGGAVLVSSHDKAFLEALHVTDQVHIVRAEVGEPGRLKVINGPVVRDIFLTGSNSTAPSSPAGASTHVAAVEEPGPAKAARKPSASRGKLTRKLTNVMRRIEHAEGLLQEAADAMNVEYNEETLAAYEAANANVEEMYERMQSLEDQLATC